MACLTPKDLEGRRIMVSAGPTQEPLDPVRFISNPSTGKMGYAIARAAEYRGAEVLLVTGPVNIAPPLNVQTVKVRTASEMAEAVFAHAEDVDVIIKTAAVADYRPKEVSDQKIKKGDAEKLLALEKNIDILRTLGERKKQQILVGFAAETQNLREYALKKLAEKNLDMIVGNLVSRPGSGFGTDTNQVTIYHRDGAVESPEQMTKDQVAHLLLDRVAEKLS